MPTISVIVPVYKAEKYIHRCVDSILSQTFQDFELILVDDGSPDKCPAICDEYAAKDSRIRVLHQENHGQAAARNHGVAIAQCDWICFVDSDDLIHHQTLERLFIGVDQNQTKLSLAEVCAAPQIPNSFWSPASSPFQSVVIDESYLQQIIYENSSKYWVIVSKLIHKSLLTKYPFPEGQIFEDNAVVFKWLISAQKIAICLDKLYFYHTEGIGTTRGTFTLKKLDYLHSLEQQIRFYKEIGYENMLQLVLQSHFQTGIDFYEKVRYELNNKSAARKLKYKLVVVWIRYWHKNPMDYPTRIQHLSRISFFFRTIYPLFLKIYRIVKRTTMS